EKAAHIFTKTGKTKKKQPNFFMVAAKEFIGKKRYKDASIVFTGLLKGAPDNSTLHYLAGISFDSLKESKKAIKHFLKVKPDSRHYKKIVIHIAFLYSDLDKIEKAIGFLENKHEELPEDIDIITYLASFYEESSEHAKAMATLEKGLVLSPDNSSLSFRLGIVQDKAGKKKECIETMKKIIALEPDNASALNYLGYTYADLGINLDTAEELINRALKIKPSDGFITDSLGWVFFKRGQYEKAIEILVKAAEITSFDPIISEHLADAYEKNNNLNKALKLYKQALSNSKDKNLELEKKIMELEKKIDKQPADKEEIDEKN
ncbi:MAG: tetratricopeptide repeat protein, partial [Thermodesulfobacteriota bacterium]|nr:tetratricopeptide repeat protein [Thermodesulfobacteriota bacterium]